MSETTEPGKAVEPYDPKKPGRRHSHEQIQRSLFVLALEGDNANAASRRLETEGIKVVPETLRRWRDHYFTAEYRKIQRDHTHELNSNLAGEYSDLALTALRAERKYVERMDAEVNQVKPADLAKAAQALNTVYGTATDKLTILRGLPNVIVERRDPDEMLRSWVARGFVDSTAEEIPEITAEAP